MKKSISIILLIIISNQAYSQRDSSNQLSWKYGITGGICVPQLPERFNPTVGWNTGVFTSYTHGIGSVFSTAGIRSMRFSNGDNNTVVNTQDFYYTIGLKSNLGRLSQSNLLVSYSPAYIYSSNQLYTGPDPIIPRNSSRLNDYTSRFIHAISLGFELELNDYTYLEASYLLPIQSSPKPAFIDGLPALLNVTCGINFNTFITQDNTKSRMMKTLSALQQDTLYIINRGCSSDYTLSQLDSIWNAAYTFSAFRIVQDHEITSIQQQENCTHFVVIGSHYAATNEPLTSGIYMLDNRLQNTAYPYPSFTKIFGGSSKCLGSLWDIANGVASFNNRLKKRMGYSDNQ